MLTTPEITTFIEHLQIRGRSALTISAYRSNIEHLFRFLGHTNPERITAADLRNWDARLGHQFKYQTRVRYRASIRNFLHVLHQLDPTHYPDLTSQLPALAHRISDPVLVAPEDFLAILEHCNEKDPVQARDGALIAFLAATGVRREECIDMRLGDIEISADGRNFCAFVRSRKPTDRIRRVNFGNIEVAGDVTSAHFGFWFTARYNLLGCHISTRARDKPLFADLRNDNKKLHPTSLYEIVKRACERTNLQRLDKVSPHSFRHFFATRAIINGMDIRVVQGYLGHSSIETTYRYVHLADKATGLQARQHGPTVGLRAKASLVVPLGDQQRFLASLPRSPSSL